MRLTLTFGTCCSMILVGPPEELARILVVDLDAVDVFFDDCLHDFIQATDPDMLHMTHIGVTRVEVTNDNTMPTESE